MDVTSTIPLRVASIVWQPRPGVFALTVLCKGTFLLRPGEAQLAPAQDALTKEDVCWGNDPTRSLRAPSDLAPTKPRADVVLVGHAFAPAGAPVRSLVARLGVGEIDKAIEVFCPRSFGYDGTLQEEATFTKMPLIYERAAGGPDTWNPVGVRRGARDAQGRIEVPNLQPMGTTVTTPGASIAPIGFGPIAPAWPERAEKLGRHAAEWSHAGWYRSPMPSDFDFGYFNVAPRDQQIAALHEDERLTLENLHPEHPHLVTRLPGIRPRAVVEPAGASPFPITLTCDTLWIDTDRSLCTVMWRAHFPVDHPRQPGRVIVTLESSAPKAPPPVMEFEGTLSADDVPAPKKIPLPFAAPAAGSSRVSPSSSGQPGLGLPFAGSQPLPPAPKAVGGAPTAALPTFAPDAALPPISAPPPLSGSQRDPPTAVLPVFTPEVAPPPLNPPTLAGPAPAPLPRTIGEAMVAKASAPEPTPIARGPQKPEMLGSPEAKPSNPAEDAAHGGLLAASNAAVGSGEVSVNWTPPRAAPARAIPDDIDGTLLQLVWFDRDSVAWMRRTEAWKPILADLEKRPPDPAFDDPVLARDPMDIEDRREVFEILLRGSPTGTEGLRATMNEAMRPDGKFVSTLVMLAGEIELPFDEVEYLKATIPTAAWFMSGDDPLRNAIEAATAFLATPGYPSATVAEGYTDNIKKAFKQKRRGPGLEFLEGPTERTLLERRAYQRRPVFGGVYIRALCYPVGSKHPIPAYFPDAAARLLPMYRRFRARLVAETQLPVDQYETHPAALRAAALGRVVPATRH